MPPNNGAVDHSVETLPPDRWGSAELIVEAETLRQLLQEACGRASRLVIALKEQRKRNKALEAAVSSLRQLRLGP